MRTQIILVFELLILNSEVSENIVKFIDVVSQVLVSNNDCTICIFYIGNIDTVNPQLVINVFKGEAKIV